MEVTWLSQKKVGILVLSFAIALIVLLAITKVSSDRRDAFLCQAVHSNPTLTMEQCPVLQSNNSWLYLIAFGVSFLILGSGLYLLFMPQAATMVALVDDKATAATRETTPIINLEEWDEYEKQVYRVLQPEGSMYQSDLIKHTGLSKVKMSRILDKLEGRNIIERKRRGMTNIVVLK